MSSNVKCTGPLFDGRADAALARGIDAVHDRVGEVGKELVAAIFTGLIRDNKGRFVGGMTTTDKSRGYRTGKYSMDVVVRDSATTTVITNDIVSYGPWLEGTGSRNETTRFKGYHGFRLATQQLDAMAAGIAEDVLIPYVQEMNG